jgi:hypothetical protein
MKTTTTTITPFDNSRLSELGYEHLLVGCEFIHEQMGALIHHMRGELEALRGHKRIGRPPKDGYFSTAGLEPGSAAHRAIESANRGIKLDLTRKLTKGGRVSMAGLKPGTAAFREAQMLNKRMEREERREGKPYKNPRKAKGYGWDNTTPEERSIEMKRRQAVARAKRKKNAAQTRWERMSQRQQKAFLAKMQAGLRAKNAAKQQEQQHVNGATA